MGWGITMYEGSTLPPYLPQKEEDFIEICTT